MPDRTPDRDQKVVVEALRSGSATGESLPLKQIDTHVSHLFLGCRHAYKLKRAVRLPFLDFSTIDARRSACEAELAANAAFASSLYEGVIPVVRGNDGHISVGGSGDVLDWVVVMRRFPDGALLNEMAKAGTLTLDLIDRTAEAVARFHASVTPSRDAGRPRDYRECIDGLKRVEKHGVEALKVAPISGTLFEALEQELAERSDLIEFRRRAGWVRRCHGDLHLRNICVYEGRVTPFDALEFDPALATTDVLYDFGFLLMDLRARGLSLFANAAMNGYWDASNQPEDALALLPLFMGMRAAVRMAVAVERGDLPEANEYRDLGLRLLRRPVPRLVAIGGLSGTGKSTLARSLAPDLAGPCGGRLLSADRIRKASAGVEPTTVLDGRSYTDDARAVVYRRLVERTSSALKAGAAVVAEATFRERWTRDDIEASAGSLPFLGLWLTAPADVRVDRVASRTCDVSDATTAVASAQIEPQDISAGWRVLDVEGPIDRVASEARRVLAIDTGAMDEPHGLSAAEL